MAKKAMAEKAVPKAKQASEFHQRYQDLEPLIRSQALVGCFLQAWSILEEELDKSISRALALKHNQAEILSVNMSLRNKINVLRSMTAGANADEKILSQLTKLIDRIEDWSTKRNLAAHSFFGNAGETDGVTFFSRKARRKYERHHVSWSIAEVEQYQNEIFQMMRSLSSLSQAVDYAPARDIDRIMETLLGRAKLSGDSDVEAKATTR